MSTTSPAARFFGIALLLAAIGLFTALASIDVDGPWEGGFRGANGGFYHGNFVKHWMKYGIDYTRGGCVLKSVPVDPPRVIYDFHHAPTYPLCLLPTVSLLGLSERSLRIAAFLLAVPALVFLWLCARRLSDPTTAGVASFLFAASPMAGFFGPMVNADGGVLTLSLFTVWCWLRERENPTLARRTATFFGIFATALMDWAGYWTGPALALLALLGPNRKADFLRVLRLAPAAVLALVAFGIHTGWILNGGAWTLDIPKLFVHEMIHLVNAGPRPTRRRTSSSRRRCGDSPSPGSAFGSFSWPPRPSCRASHRRRSGRCALYGIALLLPGLLHAVAFPRNLVIHDFWILHALPGLSLLAAVALTAVLRTRLGVPAGGAALAVMLGLMGWNGAERTIDAIAENRTITHVKNARLIRETIGPADTVATSEAFDVETFYLDNFLFPHVKTPEAFGEVYGSWRGNRWVGGRFVFVMYDYRAGTPFAKLLSGMKAPEKREHLLFWTFDG
jgi:hypothetical protein